MSEVGRELLMRLRDDMIELLSHRTSPHLHDRWADLVLQAVKARRLQAADHDGRALIEADVGRPDPSMVHGDRIERDLGDIPGIQRVNDGLYRGGGYLIEPRPDGLRLHQSLATRERTVAVRIEPHGDAFRVYTRSIYTYHGPQTLRAEVWRRGGMGSSGLDRSSTEQVAGEAALDRLERARVPLHRQLMESGFDPIGDNMLQRRHGDLTLTVTLGPDDTLTFHRPLEGRAGELVAQSRVLRVETIERESWRGGGTEPVLRLSNGWLDYTFTPQGFVTDPHVLRAVTAADVGVAPTVPHTEPSGFVRAGDNPTSSFEQLTEINGYRIADLEQWMRPQRPGEPWFPGVPRQIGSTAGFLGPHDSLRQTLARDNDLVRSLGLSHTDLAEAVQINNRLANRYSVRSYIGEGGHTYTIGGTGSLGVQNSPFRDGTHGSANRHITNATTGASVQVSDLSGHMIEQYGFYQGPGTSYRSAPEDIISTYGHLLDRVGGPQQLEQALTEINARHQWEREAAHPWDP
ncbi:hypothetical protein ACWCPQ_12520 [Nocardia sp. NPDC001965]